MATITRMPELAANTPDAVLAEWLVKEGDQVRAGDPIATVETAKATVDIEAEVAGVILRLVVEDGAEVLVGAPILVIGDSGEDISALDLGTEDAAAVGLVSETAAPAEVPVTEPTAPAPEKRVEVVATSAPSSPTTQPMGTAVDRGGRIFASPLARKVAREAELSLSEVAGSGSNGRIVRRDVVSALEARTARAPEPARETPQVDLDGMAIEWHTRQQAGAAVDVVAGYVDTPHTRLRRAIASRLTESKRNAPHFYLRGTAEVSALLDLRRKLVQETDIQISVNDLIVKAVACAHLREPKMNSIWNDEAVRRFDTVDVAVAVATETGLVTPVVRGVDSLSLSALAERTRALAKSAREGTLHPSDLEGGTVTVSNLGMFGTEEFSAIINPPHASILAVGAAVDRPVVRDGEVVVGKTLTCTLSVDHRPVDGAVAAAWMREFLALIESPLTLTV